MTLLEPTVNRRTRPILAIRLAAATTPAADDAPCPRFAAAPTIDGDLADWAGRPVLAMSDASNVKDLKAEQACLGWDEGHLYVALRMRDHALVNAGTGAGIANGDCAELRLAMPGDVLVRLLIAPTSAGGTPALHLSRRSGAKGPADELAAGTDPKAEAGGVAWAVRSDAAGWTIEASIPATLLKTTLQAGPGFPFVLIGWDRDATGTDDWQPWHRRTESANQKKPESWPRMLLAP
jgi:hypothetical protein